MQWTGSWTCLLFIEHFEYTRDVATMEKYTLPLLSGQYRVVLVTFFLISDRLLLARAAGLLELLPDQGSRRVVPGWIPL